MEQNSTQSNKHTDPPSAIPGPGDESVVKEVSRTGEVEKIRDILFGTQMQDYERRFTQFNDLLRREITHLRDDIGKRFDGLETEMNRELEGIKERLQVERDERTESFTELLERLNKSTNQLEELVHSNSEDLRHQILQQSEQLSHEIGRVHDETVQALEQSTGELRMDKVDRTALSGLLGEIALRLADGQEPDPDNSKEDSGIE